MYMVIPGVPVLKIPNLYPMVICKCHHDDIYILYMGIIFHKMIFANLDMKYRTTKFIAS